MTDAELISRAVVSEDRQAFGELVRRHQSAVRHFLRHLTSGNTAEADDLAQDTFIQAWHSLRRFHGTAAVSTWLLGIAHNLWRNARRRQQTVTAAHEHLLEPEPAQAPVNLSDLQSDVAQALLTLREEERLAVHLFYQQGLSHPEIADILQWPIGTVKTHLLRAKEKLRIQLASWNPQR